MPFYVAIYRGHPTAKAVPLTLALVLILMAQSGQPVAAAFSCTNRGSTTPGTPYYQETINDPQRKNSKLVYL